MIWAWLVVVHVLLVEPPPASPAADPKGAADPKSAASPEGPPAPSDEAPRNAADDGLVAAALSRKASQLEALMAQTLEPAVDAVGLLTLDAASEADPFGQSLRSVLDFVPFHVRPTDATPLQTARADLATARQRFFSLPEQTRKELLEAHAARRRAWLAGRDRQAELDARVARLEAETASLRALIDGTLPVDVDPTPLLTLDFGDPLVVEATRRFLGLPLLPPPPVPPRAAQRRPAQRPRGGLDLSPETFVGPPWIRELPGLAVPASPDEAQPRDGGTAAPGVAKEPAAPEGGGEPGASPAGGEPETGPGGGEPENGPAGGEPETGPAGGEPGAPPAGGEPGAPPAGDEPAAGPAGGEPGAPPADGEPAAAPTHGVPAKGPTGGESATGPTDGEPAAGSGGGPPATTSDAFAAPEGAAPVEPGMALDGAATDPAARAVDAATAPTLRGDEVANSKPRREPEAAVQPLPDTAWAHADERLRRAVSERVAVTLGLLLRPEAERQALLAAHETRRAAAKAAAEAPEDELHKEVEAASAAAIEASKQAEAAQRAADVSAKQRAEALEAARVASDEVVRAVATERARLLGVQQDQATFRARVLSAREALNGRRASAIDWRKRVTGLTERAAAEEDVTSAADQLWPDAMSALEAERNHLESSLAVLDEGATEAPEVGPPPVDPRFSAADRAVLEALHGDLVLEGKSLAALETEVRWEQVDTGVANMLHLDAARLGLISVMSDDQRHLVTGFGPQGIRQVLGALHQVQLLVRYRLASGPRLLGKIRDRFIASPVAAVIGFLELLLSLALVRWWRRSGPELLTRQLETLQRRRRPSRAAKAAMTAYWYLRQLHGPLSWLLLLAAFTWLSGDVASVAEVRFVTLIASWLLAGSAVVQLIDGLALRSHAGSEDRSAVDALRLRSLRLVGRTVVGTGLLLSVTATAVGEGAIYHWMVRMAGFLVIPVVITLVGWWHDEIFSVLASRRRKGRLLLWAERVKARRGFGHLAAAVVGAKLIGEALWRWISGRLSRYTVARRVQAWLFRRQLSLHDDGTDAPPPPLPQIVHERLHPRYSSAVSWPVNEESYGRIRKLITSNEGSVSAVVGDQGMGKSHFLNRVCAEIWEGRTMRRVSCPVGGWDAFAAALAAALGGPPPAGDEELEALIVLHKVDAIAIDDAHRLARPVIGGLRDLDRLMALTRRLPHRLDWVLTFTRPAWQFISRARGSRPQFDDVVMLAPWDERELAGWLEARAEEAGFSPNYDALAVASDSDDEEPTYRNAYARRSYFRLLWDYTDGNPGVALYFWRASLSGTADGGVLVRLFDVPDSALIAALPTTLHFVLRVTVQLELAVLSDIVDASGLWPEQVADAVRHLVGLGYLERVGDRLRVPWRWMRAVNVTLNRQHLLVA